MNVHGHCASFRVAAFGVVVFTTVALPATIRADSTTQLASWAPPSLHTVRSQILTWLDQVERVDTPDDEIAMWSEVTDSATPAQLLDLIAATAATRNPRAQTLVEQLNKPASIGELPDATWLHDATLPPIVVNNLRLLTGKWLVQEGYYDEALAAIVDLQTEDVVDPASLLFAKSVSHHQLVEVESAVQTASRLLERSEEIPVRYQQVAQLIVADLKAVEVDSLDHIARRMRDVERRLDRARTSDKVIEIEDGVIASLDKLIEELQQQRNQSQAAGQAGGSQPSSPAQDSMLPGHPPTQGSAERRNVGSGSGWGELDDKQREEALQDVGRDFPAHYRDVIEQYFKKIAAEDLDES